MHERAFTYDTDGYLLSETTEPGSPLFHTKTNTLNAYGIVEAITETWGSTDTDGIVPTSRTTSYEFDSRYRYVTREANPLGHVQTTVYHPILGVATSKTGPNGLTTTYDYDVFGRILRETRADGMTTDTSMEFCEGASFWCPAVATYRVRTVTSGGEEKLVHMDRLNREVRSFTALDNKYSKIITEYDAIGREIKKSQPHYDNTGATEYFTNTQYDILDRMTRIDRPDGSYQTASYNGLTQVSTNELGQNKTVVKNVLDKEVTVTNHQGHSLQYAYDAQGRLVSLNANGGITSYVYDIRGNKVSDTDPDKGTWIYRYNALGHIVEQTNAKGEVTRMSYDVLDRMISRIDNADAAGAENRTATWEYDTASYGLGKIHRVTGNNYSVVQVYDSLGRNTGSIETIDGQVFVTTTSYDSVSRPEVVTYPSGLAARSTYDTQGNLLKVGTPDDTLVWWERQEIDARGNVTRARTGNGVETIQTYQPDTGRLSAIYSSKGTQIVQDLLYNKDFLGNLTRREDRRLNQIETFVYDTLNRVTEISTTVDGNTGTVTLTYGITGNILSKSDVGTYTYGQVHASCTGGFAGPHAVTTVSGIKNATYCYDPNGNMVSGDGKEVVYSAFDKPVTITKGSNSANFFYGPDRKRFKRVDQTISEGTKTTLYASGRTYEHITDSTGIQLKHYLGDFAVVTRSINGGSDTSRTSYLHRDHLGSVDTITDETGTVEQRMSFDAWGKRREINWQAMGEAAIASFNTATTTRGFTGHEMIDAVGLVHMNGRVYDPELGRFLSADPIVEAMDNLQTYNRFSYVRNNPTTLTDPSGFYSVDGFSSSDFNIFTSSTIAGSYNDPQKVSLKDWQQSGLSFSGVNQNFEAKFSQEGIDAASGLNFTGHFMEQSTLNPGKEGNLQEGEPIELSMMNKYAIDRAMRGGEVNIGGAWGGIEAGPMGRSSIGTTGAGLNAKGTSTQGGAKAGTAREAPTKGSLNNNSGQGNSSQVTKRTGPKGTDPNHHNANVMVKDANGNINSHERIVSGNMTPAEKALGFPKNTLASHTEARAVKNTPLKAGDTMTITGQQPPCPSCKGYMNRATAETGATIRYQWRENGQTQIWTTGRN